MLRPWKLSPASRSRHRAQTPWAGAHWTGVGSADCTLLKQVNCGRGNDQGSVTTQQTEEGREGNSFLYEDYEEGPNLDRLPAQCACAGDGGAVRTAHARNT